jgi:hypothetical protein
VKAPAPHRLILVLVSITLLVSIAGLCLALDAAFAPPAVVVQEEPEGLWQQWRSGPFTTRVITKPAEGETPEQLWERQGRLVEIGTQGYPTE